MSTFGERVRREESGVSLVELLVAISLLAVVASATLSVVVTTSRSQNRTANLGQVMSDARTSLDRMRKEVRGARRIYGSDAPSSGNESDQDTLSFWIDDNDDDIQQVSEQITYQLVELTASGRYEIVRFTHDDPSRTRSMAKTLVNDDPFSYDVAPPETRVLELDMDFQVASGQTFEPLDIGGTVRLRNVADPT